MGRIYSVGIVSSVQKDIDAFIALWRTLGGAIDGAIERRGGQEISYRLPKTESAGVPAQLTEDVDDMDESWLRRQLERIAPGSGSLSIEVFATTPPFHDLLVNLRFPGILSYGGKANDRPNDGDIQMRIADSSFEMQPGPLRLGCDPRWARGIQLLRTCGTGAGERSLIQHAALYAESYYSSLAARGFYYASATQVPLTFRWLYLESRCDIRIPEAMRRFSGKERLPAKRALSHSLNQSFRHAPNESDLKERLLWLTAERAQKLAEIPTAALLQALKAVVADDRSWHVEESGPGLLLANDAGNPVRDIFLAAAALLHPDPRQGG